jgi:hypothetical protein
MPGELVHRLASRADSVQDRAGAPKDGGRADT